MKEGLYLVLFRAPLFQKTTSPKAMLFVHSRGQFHTDISLSIKQSPDCSCESSLVISSHSHINTHIILLSITLPLIFHLLCRVGII